MVVSRFILPAIGVLRGVDMYEQHRQRWKELCAEAAVETDRDKLVELTREINRLLQEEEERVRQERTRGTEQ